MSPRWSYRIEGRTLVFRNAGAITIGSQVEARHELKYLVRELQPGAVLVDLTRSVLALSDDDWGRMSSPSFIGPTLVRLPVAYVVAPPWLEAGRLHCAKMIEQGLTRLCFTDLQDALQWCDWNALPLLAQDSTV